MQNVSTLSNQDALYFEIIEQGHVISYCCVPHLPFLLKGKHKDRSSPTSRYIIILAIR